MRFFIMLGFLFFSLMARADIIEYKKGMPIFESPRDFNNNVKELEYQKIRNKIISIYEPIASSLGGRLRVENEWNNPMLMAYAEQEGGNWFVYVPGALARHETITEDALALIFCHEIGHHMGGAPKVYKGQWATLESQADYFASLKCLRRVFADEDSVEAISKVNVPAIVRSECEKSFETDQERAVCERSALAGQSATSFFRFMRNEKEYPSFDTPDQHVVDQLDRLHGATQCRLDTYFAGAICAATGDLNDEDPEMGTCSKGFQAIRGGRPLCWYGPRRPIP